MQLIQFSFHNYNRITSLFLSLFLLTFCFSASIFAQNITFKILNEVNNEPIQDAEISVNDNVLGISDAQGEVILDKTALENQSVLISAIGFENFQKEFP